MIDTVLVLDEHSAEFVSNKGGVGGYHKWVRLQCIAKPVINKGRYYGLQRLIKPVTIARKIGRNELCPCGSKKKYKKCCISKAPAQ